MGEVFGSFRLCFTTTQDHAWCAHLLQHIYVDLKRVAKEYLRRNKAKAWKLQKVDDSLKRCNLEPILEAEELGEDTPVNLMLHEYLEGM